MMKRTLGFIGAGKMAEALARGVLRAGIAKKQSILASDPAEERRRVFAKDVGVRLAEDNAALVQAAEVVVLSVKPQVIAAVVAEIAPKVTPEHFIVSIAPGINLAWLAERLGTARLARVMPNTPALVGAGAAAFCRGSSATHADAALVAEMLGAVGVCIEVEEALMDAVTGLSGSGPAYVYTVIEAMCEGGVKMGLERETAMRLAAQTVLGAAKMVLETGKAPAELRDQVTTPGGTTIEGLKVLDGADVKRIFMDAVEAATRKSKLLGEKRQ